MFTCHADVAITDPQRCLLRLCRHWSHKFQVQHDETSAHIPFEPAVCDLNVTETGLHVSIQAPDEAELVELQGVVLDHLQRMAGEPLQADWQG